MWSRLAASANRTLVSKSLFCLPNRYIHRNVVLQKYDVPKKPKSRNQIHENQAKKVFTPILHKPVEKILIAQNDPRSFGTLKPQVTEHEPDEGDIAEDEHYRTIPLRRDQLTQRRYEHMIKTFIRDKRLKEAIDVLEVRMKEDRVKPSYYIYQLLIMECGRWGYTKKAFKLYSRMKKRGLAVTGPTYVGLFNAVANDTVHPKIGLELAQNLRKQMFQKGFNANEIIYNTMIKAFGRCGDIETAFSLVDEMKEKKLRLKVDTMNHLLQACCSDKEYGFRHALLVWHKIYRRKMVPDQHSFNLMIRCTRDCGIGDINEMQKVIAGILTSSVKLKTNQDKVLRIEQKPLLMLNETEQNASENEPKPENELVVKDVCDQMPNLLTKLPHLGSIVELSMVNSPEDRLTLLGGLSGVIAEMEATKSRPNVKTFTQLLEIIPSKLEAEHELIQKMSYMRVRADTDFFNILMKRRILRKDYDGGKNVLAMIDKVNLSPDIATYGIMAMGCVTHEQALEFIEKLTEKGVRFNNEILGALLKNATYNNDYDYVIDVLEYVMHENIKPSIRFYEMLAKFKNARYNSLQQIDDDEKLIKYNRFYVKYKSWKSQMGLSGLSTDEVVKLLRSHPWKQLKQAEGEGIEAVKNKKTRRIWKRQHTVAKLTSNRLERMHNNHQSDTDKKDTTKQTKRGDKHIDENKENTQ
ncbi:pentatricopeptide repeat-containing protein 1, mitochondrial-like [Contarinia nasturtii]|uniref:pentatricopeptide repeat-containing protein 1, mitochondrial-like n=1 Tax=Contarinia nasturtii TaxID=265458 RepID=UPI0012D3FEFA|nr:pentatricopeptide repeat-containing protein 1, mitochondrial-like [Contarinia nasturtii]